MPHLNQKRRLTGHRGTRLVTWLGVPGAVRKQATEFKMLTVVRLHTLQVCASAIGSSEPALFLAGHGDWTTAPRWLQVASHGGTREVELCSDWQKCCATWGWYGCIFSVWEVGYGRWDFHCDTVHSSSYICSICAVNGKRWTRFMTLNCHLPLLMLLNTDPHLLHHRQHGTQTY